MYSGEAGSTAPVVRADCVVLILFMIGRKTVDDLSERRPDEAVRHGEAPCRPRGLPISGDL